MIPRRKGDPRSNGSISRGERAVPPLGIGLMVYDERNRDVTGEGGRYFYRPSKVGTRKSAGDYQGQDFSFPDARPGGEVHPSTLRVDTVIADSTRSI